MSRHLDQAYSEQAQIVKDHLQLYPDMGSMTIARIIEYNFGNQFDNDLEKIRSMIRYYRGSTGKKARADRHLDAPLTPVYIPKSWGKTRTPFNLEPSGTWLIVNDLHVPFHRIKPIESMIAFAHNQPRIDGILYNGDFSDCAAISYWPSSRKRDFDAEIAETIRMLDFFNQEFPKAKKILKPGNHEYRLPRLYQTRAPECKGIPLAVMNESLGLDARGIEILDYHQLVYAGKLPILHGHEVRRLDLMVNPARGLFLRLKSWGACGHCHRTSENTEKDIMGTLLTTWSMGCLCDLSPDFDPYSNGWNWGFGLAHIDKNGDFEMQNRRILPNGKVV